MAKEPLENGGGGKLRFDKHSLQEIWNSESLKSIRRKMLEGEKLKGCQSCWDEEKTGKLSKRKRENMNFLGKSAERLAEAAANGGHLSQNPIFLDLRMGNLCNLKCRSCGPLFSSAWAGEMRRRRVDYQKSQVLTETYQETFKRAEKISQWFAAPVFFETVEAVREGLANLYLSGGEPLLIKGQLALLERLLETGDAAHIKIQLHSNITKLPPSFMENLGRFKRVDFGVSIDAYGERNNWLRSPSKFSLIERNMERLLEISQKSRNIIPYINCATSAFNVLSLGELIRWSRKLSSRFGIPIPVNFDMIHWPAFHHISVLREDLKREAKNRLEAIGRDDSLSPRLLPQEENGLNHLIRVLESPPKPRASDIFLRKQMEEHTLSIDKFRGESFFQVFPEFGGRF